MKLPFSSKPCAQQDLQLQRCGTMGELLDGRGERFMHSNALDVDEVIFCILDSMVDNKVETVSAAANTILRFGRMQQDFTIRSILYFLEVQKTTEAHQNSLLSLLRKCITQAHDTIPADLMRDVLLFILKELSFLSTSDIRHAVMVETLKETAVLCPAFSVEVILAFITGMRQEGSSLTETLCIYIRVLSHVFDKASHNDYIRGVSLVSQIASLYDSSTVCGDSGELCRTMVTLLVSLAKALYSIPVAGRTDRGPTDSPKTVLFSSLALEDPSSSRFASWYDKYRKYSPAVSKPQVIQRETMSVRKLGNLVDGSYTTDPDVVWSARSDDERSEVTTARRLVVRSNHGGRKKRASSFVTGDYFNPHFDEEPGKGFVEVPSLSIGQASELSNAAGPISFPMRSDSGMGTMHDVMGPLFALLVDQSLPSVYANPNHADTCLEVLNSLSLLSKHVSDDILHRYGATLLDSIVVRFYQYLPGTPYRHRVSENRCNTWMALQKESKDTYRNKLATILSSIGNYADKNAVLPPQSLVTCLWNFCKVLMDNHAHIVLLQMPNICEVLFGLLVGLQVSGKEALLSLCDSSLVSHSAEEDDLLLGQRDGGTFLNIRSSESCKDFLSTLVCACRFFVSNVSTHTYFVDFLFKKAMAGGERETAASLFMLGWSCSHPLLCDTLLWHRTRKTLHSDFSRNCGLFWRLIDTLHNLVSKISIVSANPCTTRLIVSLINHLSRGQWLTFHCLVGYRAAPEYGNGLFSEEDPLIITQPVDSLLNLVFNLKVSYDLEERIAENTSAWAKQNDKLNAKFFRKMYYGKKVVCLDLGLLVSSSASFESFLLLHSGDLMFIYLVKSLLSNSKMNALTAMRSLYRLFKCEANSCLSKRCSKKSMVRVLAFILLYLHDPIDYFAEALSAAKLLPHVTLALFGKKLTFCREIWFKRDYKGLDAYILNYEPGEGYSQLSGMDHIVLHFEKMSGLLNKMSLEPHFPETTETVITQLHRIVGDLKAPVNTYTSLLKLGNIQASSSITAYHTIGILHILAMYATVSVDLCSSLVDLLLGYKGAVLNTDSDHRCKIDSSLLTFVADLRKWAALTMVTREKVRYTMLQLRISRQFNGENAVDRSMQDPRLFYNLSPEEVLNNEIMTLRGLVIGYLGMNEVQHLGVLCKVYYSLLTRLPSVSAMFTKFASPTFGENLKPVALTALAYLYAHTPKESIKAPGFQLENQPLSDMDKQVSHQMDLLANISDESHLVHMYNCCLRVSHEAKVRSDLGEEDVTLKCVIVPILYFCFHDNGPLVQLAISRAFILAKRTIVNRAQDNIRMGFPLIALKRMLYFVSNPAVKEFAINQVYDTSKLEQQYSHLFHGTRWDMEFRNLKAVEVASLKATTDGIACSNVSLSYFCATCHLSDLLHAEEDVFTTLHTLLSFGDYFRSHVQSRASPKDIWPEYINIDELSVQMMVNCWSNCGWQRLSHILSVVLFLSEEFPKDLVTHRVSLVVSFLSRLDFRNMPDRNVDQNEKMSFVDCVLILWAHVIRLEAGSALRSSLCEYLKRVLGVRDHPVTVSPAQADPSISDDLERIDLLIPKDLLMISLLQCMKYLSASTCVIGSFTIILQLILQQRYADLDHKHLESILTTIFNNFSTCFEENNVPYSMTNFVIDLAQTDFGVLCNVIYSPSNDYKSSFKLSVAKLITADASLMLQLLGFMKSCLLAEYRQVPDKRYSVSMEVILDFTEGVYLNKDKTILKSDEAVSFMLTLATHFLRPSKDGEKPGYHLMERFKNVLEELIPVDGEPNCRATGRNETIKLPSFTGKKKPRKDRVMPKETQARVAMDVRRLSLSLLISSESYKLCFLRFMECIVNRQNDFKPTLLRRCMSVFCILLKEGVFRLYGGLVLCLIQKITLFKDLQKYYYKAVHYYLQSAEIKKMGTYVTRIVSARFKSSRNQEKKTQSPKKSSPVLSLDMKSLKHSILDRLVISLLDDLLSPLSSGVLYSMERAAASLVVYVSTHKRVRVRNFNYLLSTLLVNYWVLVRNEPKILFAFSQLYVAIARWLDSCAMKVLEIPVELQRRLIPPLGSLILHRSVAMRSDGTSKKLTHYLARLLGSSYIPTSAHTSSFSWIKTVLLRRVLGSPDKNKLCMCGCNNPAMANRGDVRFCVCHAFYLLDLFSSCFIDDCWNLELVGVENIGEEIERLKKDEHLKRTTQVLFGPGEDPSSKGVKSNSLPSARSTSSIILEDENNFFDLNAIYKVRFDRHLPIGHQSQVSMQMLTADSMPACLVDSVDSSSFRRQHLRGDSEPRSSKPDPHASLFSRENDGGTSLVASWSSQSEGRLLGSAAETPQSRSTEQETPQQVIITALPQERNDTEQSEVDSPETVSDKQPSNEERGAKNDPVAANTTQDETNARVDNDVDQTNVAVARRRRRASQPTYSSLQASAESRKFVIAPDSKKTKEDQPKEPEKRRFTVKRVHRVSRHRRRLRKKRSMGRVLNSIPCLPSMLSLLTIDDLRFRRHGGIRRIKVLDSEVANDHQPAEFSTEQGNVNLFDIWDINSVRISTLCSSPEVYRFMLVRKYLTRERLYPAMMNGFREKRSGKQPECIVPEEVMVNAVRGVVAILHLSIIHLSKESEQLRIALTKNGPHCLVEMARYNAIVRFEALGRAATKQLCKMLETYTGRMKRILLESMELLAIARSPSLRETDQEYAI